MMMTTTLTAPTTRWGDARVARSSGFRRSRGMKCVARVSTERRGTTVTKMESSETSNNEAVSQLALRGRDARELAPPSRHQTTVAVVGSPNVAPMTGGGEFMTPSFAFYALCGVGCLLGSALSAVLLALIPTLRSVRRTMDEIAYLAASVREEVPDTLAAVRVSGLELTDCMEEVGELTADLGGGIRSAGRGITASVNTAQALGRYAASALPEVKKRAKPIVGGVRDKSVQILQERADMEPYSGPVIANTASTAKKGVVAARNALKSADVARNVGRLYKTIRAPPARPKDK